MSSRFHVDRLIWDDWNIEHLTKHAVTPEEAEAVVVGEPLVRTSYKNRLVFIGPTTDGRILTVVAGPVPAQGGAYYVFSARPASRSERAAYRQQRGETSQ